MSNKVMIVSGGASGLGLAAAEKFRKERIQHCAD
jgi:NAD(P)-dependent dehydrogenase (short-subunit alcohol dehydrogenase family)